MNGEIEIRELLSRRNDLSAFLVHLTRDSEKRTAKRNLRQILKTQVLQAKSAFGPASTLRRKSDKESQQCVSFTEVPLTHLHCLTSKIPKRQISLSPYGLAFTKMKARERGANPVWYIDMTPGHDFLMKHVNKMIEQEDNGRFASSALAKICPFIEQMGSGVRKSDNKRYQKEFWWEREWRYVGDFRFFPADVALGFAPEDDIEEFEKMMHTPKRRSIRFVDPRWSADQIIARLACCRGTLSPFDVPED